MIRFVFSSFSLVFLVCSLGLLVVPAQPVSAGMGGYEDPYGGDPTCFPPAYPGCWSLWPGGRVPVVISKSFQVNQFSNIDEHDTISQGLNAWRDRTGSAVRFEEISEEEAESEDRYLHILTPDDYVGKGFERYEGYCNSWGPHTIGPTYTVLTRQDTVDGPSCINLPSIVHEVGHAIGLGHEQGRPDRKFYMAFQDPYVPVDSNDKPPDPDKWPDAMGPDPVGFFDYYSIMHTRMPPHATPLSPDVYWPPAWACGPSDGDIDMVRGLYGFDLYYYSDIAGGDFASFPLANDAIGRPATQRFCQLACAADVRCKAYTFVGIGVQGNNEPLCYLKNVVSSPATTLANIHSGVRRYDEKCSFGVAFNVDLFGGQISDGVVSMPHNLLNGNNCKDLCAQDQRCDAFTFVPGDVNGTCYKKTHNQDLPEPLFTYQRRDGYMSGVIRRANDPLNLAPTSDAGGPYTVEWNWVSIPSTPEQDARGTVTLNGTGSGDPEGSPLAYFWTTDCPGASFDDSRIPNSNLTVFASSTLPICSTQCNVSLIVTDDQCFRSSRSTSTVTIQDTTPPTLIGVPADQSFECGDIIPPPAHVTATDSYDPSVIPTFTETWVDGSCAANYTLKRTWIAVDDCGNSTSATQIITVQDIEGPNISCHDDSFITPSQAPISFTATATDRDSCGDATAQITGFNCVGKKGKSKLESCDVVFSGSTITIRDSGGVGDTISWTVQATDSCGNITNKTCVNSVVNLAEYREIYE